MKICLRFVQNDNASHTCHTQKCVADRSIRRHESGNNKNLRCRRQCRGKFGCHRTRKAIATAFNLMPPVWSDFFRQHGRQRLIKSDIYMYRTFQRTSCGRHSIIHQTVGIPQLFLSSVLRGNVDRSAHDIIKTAGLSYSLAVVLINPAQRSVSRHRYKRDTPVVSFGDSRSIIKQCSSRCAHSRYGSFRCQRHSKGDKSGRTFIDHNMRTETTRTDYSHNQRCVPRTRRKNHIFHTPGMKQVGDNRTRLLCYKFCLLHLFHTSPSSRNE